MTVEVINMQRRLSGNPLNGVYFADSFVRADQPFFTGNNWATILTGEMTGYTGVGIEGMIDVAANELVLSTVGGGGFVGLILYPIPLDRYKLWTFPQFAEAEFRSSTATAVLNSQMGPCVFCQPNSDVAVEGTELYCAMTFNDVPNGRYIYGARGSLGAVNLGLGFTNIVAGDVCRIEVTPSAASNEVRMYKNGVLVGTAVDANANRPQFGMPGFSFGFQANTINTHWRNFKCGVLPQRSTLANFP